jgi:hypothetical protein
MFLSIRQEINKVWSFSLASIVLVISIWTIAFLGGWNKDAIQFRLFSLYPLVKYVKQVYLNELILNLIGENSQNRLILYYL